MTDAAHRPDDRHDELERDAMVASLLGISPDRLRTIRRVHSKRERVAGPAGAEPVGGVGRPGARWQEVDQLDHDQLCEAVRRREARARAAARVGVAAPVERPVRRQLGRR